MKNTIRIGVAAIAAVVILGGCNSEGTYQMAIYQEGTPAIIVCDTRTGEVWVHPWKTKSVSYWNLPKGVASVDTLSISDYRK
jgi:hypothetical protein